jgi:hypothetical protein
MHHHALGMADKCLIEAVSLAVLLWHVMYSESMMRSSSFEISLELIRQVLATLVGVEIAVVDHPTACLGPASPPLVCAVCTALLLEETEL